MKKCKLLTSGKTTFIIKVTEKKAVKCTMEKDNLIKQLKEIVKHELNTQEQLRNRLKKHQLQHPVQQWDGHEITIYQTENFFEPGQDIAIIFDSKYTKPLLEDFSVNAEIPLITIPDFPVTPPYHTHEFFEFFYVYQGKCYSTIEGQYREFQQGDICLYSLQSVHNIIKPEETDIIFNILIRPSLLKETFLTMLADNNPITHFFVDSLQDKELENPYMLFHCEPGSSIEFYLQKMIVEYFSNKSNEGTQKYLKILLLGFLTQLAAEYGKELDLEQLDLTQIQIMEYISNHYADGTLAKMAEYFHYSPRNMIYYLHKHTGKKFSELQKEARIQAMKRLLSTTKMPVSKIAEEVGYSIKFASTVFKQEIGMTMSQYRKQHQ